jgi:hypothetical protein
MDVWKIIYSINCMFLGSNITFLAYYYGGAFRDKSRICNLYCVVWCDCKHCGDLSA